MSSKDIEKLKKPLSQLDMGGVLKSAHDDGNQGLRVTNANTSVPSSYSRVDLTYNSSDSVTKAVFYGGNLPEIRQFTFSAASTMTSGDYFDLYSSNDVKHYYVWFNIDGGGGDPAIADAEGIEVPITSSDTASIVTLGAYLVLKNIKDFCIEKQNNVMLAVTNVKNGPCTNSTSNTGGILVELRQDGGEELIKSIDIPFDSKSRYIYNTQERKFEVESIASLGTVSVEVDADDGDNISISRHEEYRNITDEDDFTAGNLSTSTYTEIFSYTSTEALRARRIKVKADTFGYFRAKVDGSIVDYFQTSPTVRNAMFDFIEDLDIPNTSELTIEFLPERLRLSDYNFFLRIEGYVK